MTCVFYFIILSVIFNIIIKTNSKKYEFHFLRFNINSKYLQDYLFLYDMLRVASLEFIRSQKF